MVGEKNWRKNGSIEGWKESCKASENGRIEGHLRGRIGE